MSVHSRQPDYLWRHLSLGRRVTNLETGVHPTTANTDYWDSYGPDTITDSSSILAAVTGATPKWSRRTGIVYLSGAVGGDLEDIPGVGEVYSTLPREARPNEAQEQMAAINVSPFWLRVRVATNGELRIMEPSSGTGAFELSLHNISYPAD